MNTKRVPTATPEDDRGEKAEPRRYALLTLIRQSLGPWFESSVPGGVAMQILPFPLIRAGQKCGTTGAPMCAPSAFCGVSHMLTID